MVCWLKMKIKGKKAQVQITLSPITVKKSRELGLNISKISENALNEAIRRLESPVSKIGTQKQNESKMVRGEGFEPSNSYETAASGLRL